MYVSDLEYEQIKLIRAQKEVELKQNNSNYSDSKPSIKFWPIFNLQTTLMIFKQPCMMQQMNYNEDDIEWVPGVLENPEWTSLVQKRTEEREEEAGKTNLKYSDLKQSMSRVFGLQNQVFEYERLPTMTLRKHSEKNRTKIVNVTCESLVSDLIKRL